MSSNGINEIKKFLANYGTKWIKDADTNKDSAVTKNEFSHFIQTNYNGIGMTIEELQTFFMDCFGEQHHYSWQMVEGEVNDSTPSKEAFDAISLTDPAQKSFSYPTKAYPELAKIFCLAGESTIGKINYTSEFTDSSPALAKSFAVTTTVRVRDED